MAERRRGRNVKRISQSERERVQKWRARIARARRMREEWEGEYSVETLERYYLGKQTDLGSETQYSVWLNHFFATIQTQRPALLPTKLSFTVEQKPGRGQGDKLKAKTLGGVLDTIARQDNHLMKSLRLALTQAFFRVGVLKACYEPTMEPNPSAGQPLLGEMEQALVGPGGEELTEPAETLTDEVYRWRWVNAKHMLLPDEGPDVTTWSWLGEEVEVTLADAKADTRFPSSKRNVLKANGKPTWDDPQRDTQGTDLDDDQQMFRYAEIWDMKENRVYCLADGQEFDGFLWDSEYPDGVEDKPYALLSFIPIIGPKASPWPKPVTYDWLPIQANYNTLREQMIAAGKRAARKILYEEATFSDWDEARKALASAVDLEGVKVTDVGRPFVVVGDGAQSVDVTRNIPFLLADWQRVTGASGTRLGDPDADTATEAVITEQAAGVRDSEMRTLVQEWLTEAGSQMLQLVQQTLTLDLWVELRGMDDRVFQEFIQSPGFRAYLALRVGAENVPAALQMFTVMPGMQEQLKARFGELKPIKVSRTDLQMEADVQAVPSTVRPIYRAQLLQLVNILGPAAFMSPTLLEELLASFELPQGEQIAEEIITNLRQQAAMMAQQQQQRAMGGARPQQPGLPANVNGASPLQTQNPLGAVSGGMV